jgi:hypothetical protein
LSHPGRPPCGFREGPKRGHKVFRRFTLPPAGGPPSGRFRFPPAQPNRFTPAPGPAAVPFRPPGRTIGRMMGRMIGKGDAAAVFSPIARDRSRRANHFRAFTRHKAAARPPGSFPAANAPAARQATVGRAPPRRPPGREPTASRLDGHPAVDGRSDRSTSRLKVELPAGPIKLAWSSRLDYRGCQQGGKFTRSLRVAEDRTGRQEGSATRSRRPREGEATPARRQFSVRHETGF